MARNCIVENCNKIHKSRGFCDKHYEQWFRGRKPELDNIVLPKITSHKCSIEGCNKTSEGKNLCGSHYRKWRRSNGLDFPPSKEYMDNYMRSFNGRFASLKRAAKDMNLGFNINKEQYAELLKENKCTYCNGKLNPTGHCLDRKDTNKGYVLDNVVSCCVTCNRIKNKYLSYEEMKFLMQQLQIFRNYNLVKEEICGS